MRTVLDIPLEVVRIEIEDLCPETVPVAAVLGEVVLERLTLRVERFVVDGDVGLGGAGVVGLAEDFVEEGHADVGGVDAQGGRQFEDFEDLAFGGAEGEGGAGVGDDSRVVEMGGGGGDGEEDELVEFGGQVAVCGDGAGPVWFAQKCRSTYLM